MFFSVKTSTKILGKVYTPCVCYKAPDSLIPTVEKMVKDGKAYAYDHMVYFQSGKVLEKKPEVKEESVEKKPSKKAKKENKVEPEEFVKEAEEIVAPTDESEGF